MFTILSNTLRNVRCRELLLWCLPALLVGLALRVALTAHQPWAYYHDDTPDFLATPDRLLFEGEWNIHGKKTFLGPILFTIPFLLRIPALIAIPLFQHLLGLAQIVLVGLLCRLWLRHWKWFIVPLTLLIAVNPFLLWYEHTLMAETIFVFCTLLVALAGTLYAQEQTRGRFTFLCIALFLEAGSRPEGKLLFGFGLFLLTLVHARDLRANWQRFAALGLLAVGTHFISRSSQAGLLLYTSVARITPQQLTSAPGFEPYIGPLREDLQQRWKERPSFPRVRDRRLVADAVGRYLVDRGGGKKKASVDSFCLELAIETCWRNLAYLPVHALHKFRYVSHDAPSGRFDNLALFEKQRGAYTCDLPRTLRLSRGLVGRPLANEAEVHRFIDTRYGEVPWFNALSERWLAAVNFLHFPDSIYPPTSSEPVPFIYHGVPLYFVLALAGVVVAMLARGALQPFHIAWGLTLVGFFFVIMLTANVRPRFRFVFEPLWFLYLAVLLDWLGLGIRSLFSRTACVRAAPAPDRVTAENSAGRSC